MVTSQTHRLPHGAKGIDLGDAIVALGKDKIVLSRKAASEHVTVHFGPGSGVLDVHKTSTAGDGSVSHQTMYTIRHGDLAALLAEVGPVASHALMNTVRQLDLDELERKRIGVIVGLAPTHGSRAFPDRRLTFHDVQM